MSADAGRDLGGGRRVGVQVPLVQPHRADVHGVRRVRRGTGRGSARSSRRRCRSTSTGSAGVVAQVTDRAVEGERGLLVAREHLGPDAEPRLRRRRRTRRRWRRRGWPRSRRTGSAETSCSAISAAYSSIAANVRSSASSASRPVRSTPWPSRTIRVSRTATSGRSPTSSLIVLVPQSIAATSSRSMRALDRHGSTQGPDDHQSPSRSSTSSPSGFTPRPWASAWPASTCRHLTRSGIPPAEMPSISGTSPESRRAASR